MAAVTIARIQSMSEGVKIDQVRSTPSTCAATSQPSSVEASSSAASLRTAASKGVSAGDVNSGALLVAFLDLAEFRDVDFETASTVLRCLKLLVGCDFELADVCSVLAHASAYFLDIPQLRRARMSNTEAAYILMMSVYLAHSYVMDENIPLKVWHKFLFRDYCSLDMLDKAILQVMKLRGYILRVDGDSLAARYERLCRICNISAQQC